MDVMGGFVYSYQIWAYGGVARHRVYEHDLTGYMARSFCLDIGFVEVDERGRAVLVEHLYVYCVEDGQFFIYLSRRSL